MEGCWDKPFADLGFETAANFFGSGFKLKDDQVTFVTSTHPLDPLYVHSGPGVTTVSNSLAFLLKTTGIHLPVGPRYGRAFASIANGLEAADNQIYAGPEGTIRRTAVANIAVSRNNLTEAAKAPQVDFDSFAAYTNYLTSTLSAVFENGADAGRNYRYSPLTSCSSGYDSTACSVLAARLGCGEGVTLKTARSGLDDSGRKILEFLKLRATGFDREDRSQSDEFGEAEFLATGMGGEDYAYAAFEPKLSGRIFLTGFFADLAWHIDGKPGLSFERTDNSIAGGSLTEFRLRTGFAHLPVPVIGLSQETQPQLLQIGRHPDMKPYSVGGGYDKPVPRRIAEENGLPRELFGRKKKAASILFHRSTKTLSDASQRSFEEFRNNAPGRIQTNAKEAVWLCWWWLWRTVFFLGRRLKISPLLRPIERTLFRNFTVYEHSSPITSDLLFLWGLKKTQERYSAPRE